MLARLSHPFVSSKFIFFANVKLSSLCSNLFFFLADSFKYPGVFACGKWESPCCLCRRCGHPPATKMLRKKQDCYICTSQKMPASKTCKIRRKWLSLCPLWIGSVAQVIRVTPIRNPAQLKQNKFMFSPQCKNICIIRTKCRQTCDSSSAGRTVSVAPRNHTTFCQLRHRQTGLKREHPEETSQDS